MPWGLVGERIITFLKNMVQNLYLKLEDEEIKEAHALKDRLGFSTLTGMIKFIIRNGEKIMDKMLNK
ncbi:hypothetical protein KJ781_04405 [Patescibacteria group bacterium]|nr:hypothetical protein [Patescibacteria group bacterium]MBU1449075.1 hypothetical protein [Patescibacteria group bacterium]